MDDQIAKTKRSEETQNRQPGGDESVFERLPVCSRARLIDAAGEQRSG